MNVSVRTVLLIFACAAALASAAAAASPKVSATADRLDELILGRAAADSLPIVDDAIWLRRVCLDLIGRPATPAEITRFGLDPSPDKRRTAVQRLLASDEYGQNWSRYWADTILLRATNMRAGIVRPTFEEWMADSLNRNRSWDEIVTDILTATGSVLEEGATVLFFAHEGKPEEVAAEASRLFTGIQIQCANCHDHPWDRWKREEFHELAAFFPRVSVRQNRESDRRFDYVVSSMNIDRRRRRGISEFLLTRLDRDQDRIISQQEAQRSPLRFLFAREEIRERVDSDGDGRLSFKEIMEARPRDNNRPGRGSTEHYMPDLNNPSSEGTRVDPVFFLSDQSIPPGSDDQTRRQAAARFITDPGNIWFARAIVNRMWAELTGTAFYTPVDDIGPDRPAEHEQALQFLADAFVQSGYDLKWLLEVIASTRIYQRDLQPDAEGFAAMQPTRMRADQLYAVLCQSLGVDGLAMRSLGARRRNGIRDPGRGAVAEAFGFDPSVPRSEVSGSIPQALLMMNSPIIEELIDGRDRTSPLGRIQAAVRTDDDAIAELYLLVLGREPTRQERQICRSYLQESPDRIEGMEDIFWALLNSTEFLVKR